MLKKQSYHVVYNSDGGWVIKKSGASRALKQFDSKDKAIDFGRMVSKRASSELVIHGKDGTISEVTIPRSDKHSSSERTYSRKNR